MNATIYISALPCQIFLKYGWIWRIKFHSKVEVKGSWKKTTTNGKDTQQQQQHKQQANNNNNNNNNNNKW